MVVSRLLLFVACRADVAWVTGRGVGAIVVAVAGCPVPLFDTDVHADAQESMIISTAKIREYR